MAKQSKTTELTVAPKTFETPDTLKALNITLNTAEDVRAVVHSMKVNALNNYVALAKIESTKAYSLLGYDSIQTFVKEELRGIVSFNNAMGFLDYVYEQTDGAELDNNSIAGLLSLYKDEKIETKKPANDKTKEKLKYLNKAVESKTIELEQKEMELEALRNQLDELAREKGVDPDRYMLVKSEDSLREYIDKNRVNAIQAITALKNCDPEILKLISYGELKLTLGAISQSLGEVFRQYEQYFVGEEILSKLGD
jgi:hypothetical protein